jgi:hypothetical protein
LGQAERTGEQQADGDCDAGVRDVHVVLFRSERRLLSTKAFARPAGLVELADTERKLANPFEVEPYCSQPLFTSVHNVEIKQRYRV